MGKARNFTMRNNNSAVPKEDLFTLSGEARLKLYLESPANKLVVTKIDRLTGDASTRQYFRLFTNEQSLIAAVYQESFDPLTHSFCDINQLLTVAKLPVPAIVAADGEFGVILTEDLGDIRLQDLLETATNINIEEAYQEAIDLIVQIQAATPQAYESHSCSSQLAFDEAKLLWELEFFATHYFASYLQLTLTAERETRLKAELQEIAQELAARPRTLCHRDFHSRNLMIYQNRQYIIDHQDARMGPYTYDLASLLCDPYVTLTAEMVARLYNYYIKQSNLDPALIASLANEFELMTVQRIVKAIGTYAYQTAVRQNMVYVSYIPKAIATVVTAATKLQRFPELCSLLTETSQPKNLL